MSTTTGGGADHHVGSLDGLRALAALWVYLSHVALLTGMRILPVLSWGDMAVDLFMMISGFLMAHHYLHRRDREPWSAPSTWRAFWLRRFFRIAPAYYLLLIVALLIGPWLGECSMLIAGPFPGTTTPVERYTDASLANVAAHASFVFGTLPAYAFRTPLPDWSIGLEMQFYAVFPFLMLLIGVRGRAVRLALAVALAFAALWLFRGYGARCEMPAYGVRKLQIFLLGVLLAYGRRGGFSPASLALIAGIVLFDAWRQGGVHGACFALLVIGFGLLVAGPAQLRSLARVRAALSTPLASRAGEYAYCLYLIHLLWLIPVAGLLTLQPWYLELKGVLRFLTCIALSLPPTLLCCAAIYRFVETPGIRLGKRLVAGRPALTAPAAVHP